MSAVFDRHIKTHISLRLGDGSSLGALWDLIAVAGIFKQVITSSPEFSKKSSSYNNLVTMAATVVCNYNPTHCFSRRGQGPQSVFMNGRVHHYMRIASSTLQNCGIFSFMFDDIASLARSADFCLFCHTSADMHKYMLALKGCLLAELKHLLGQRLTRKIIVSFCLHLNQQKMACTTQVKLNLPIMFYPFCDWAMGTMSKNIDNNPHQERCVGRMWGGSLSKMLHFTHEGCKVKVHRFCQIDWLH